MNVMNMLVKFQNVKCHTKREILDQKLKVKKLLLKSHLKMIKAG